MFKLYKGKITIDLDKVDNEDMKALVTQDKSKGGIQSLQAIMYLYFLYDLSDDNPLKDVAYTDKKKEALLRAYGDSEYDIVAEVGDDYYEMMCIAGSSYYKHNVEDADKDLYTYDKKMDQIREMLNVTHPTIVKNTSEKGTVSYSTNITIINKALASVLSIIQTKSSTLSLKIEGVIPKHLRGGLSPLSKGNIKI